MTAIPVENIGEIPRSEVPELMLVGVDSETTPEVPTIADNFTLVSFYNGHNPQALTDAQGLRAKVYVDEKAYLTPDALDENGLEADLDDRRSLHVVVYTNQEGLERQAVGTVRFIEKITPEEKLPIEELFPEVKVQSGSVEGSRLIVDKDYRAAGKTEFIVSLAMYRAMYFNGIDKGIDYAYAVAEEGLLEYLEWMGFPYEVVSDEAKFIEEYNTTNVAVRFPLKHMYEEIKQADLRGREGAERLKLAPFYARGRSSRGEGDFSVSDIKPPKDQMVSRNTAFIGRNAQRNKIAKATVAIAGVGGDGGQAAVKLARMGVESFKLADPDVFDIENLNRQESSNWDTIGRNKAEVIAETILGINPWADISVFPQGVNPDNIDEFMGGSTVLLDETDYERPEIGALLARAARDLGIVSTMAINYGFGAQATSFRPDGYTFEKYLGLSPDMTLEEIAETTVASRKWVAQVARYSDWRTFKPLMAQEVPAPSLAPGVDAASNLAVTEITKHILGDRRFGKPVFAPNVIVFDAMEGKYDVIRHRTLSYGLSIARLGIRSVLGMTPRVDV